jgi:hypothetical protein
MNTVSVDMLEEAVSYFWTCSQLQVQNALVNCHICLSVYNNLRAVEQISIRFDTRS